MLSITVSSALGDDSAGTLHAAILEANATPGPDEIVIDYGITSIGLTQALPSVIEGVTIKPAGNTQQRVTISDNSSIPGGLMYGLDLTIPQDEPDAEDNVFLERLNFTGFGCGLHVGGLPEGGGVGKDVGYLEVDRCDFYENEWVGVLFSRDDPYSAPVYVHVDNVWFHHCNIYDNEGDGLAFYGQIPWDEHGIYSFTLTDCTISGNEAPLERESHGIRLCSHACIPFNGYMANSAIYGNANDGIYLEEVNGWGIRGCHIGCYIDGNDNLQLSENGDSGIHLAEGLVQGEGTTNTFITLNTLHDSEDGSDHTAAIALDGVASVHSNQIVDNTFIDCGNEYPWSFVTEASPLCQHQIPTPSLDESRMHGEGGQWVIPLDIAGFPEFFDDTTVIGFQLYWGNSSGDWVCPHPIGSEYSMCVAAWEEAASDPEMTFYLYLPQDPPQGYDCIVAASYCYETKDTSMMSSPVFFPVPPSEVAGRYVFYDGSYLVAAGDENDAIDWSKAPLLSDTGNVTPANITGYDRGLNGIMIDIDDIASPTEIDATDFAFAMGVGGSWSSADGYVESIDVFVGGGESGSDRIMIKFNDGVIKDRWLRTTVKSNADTGLGADDVFYFGNLSGDTDGNRTINSTDLDAVRANWGQTGRLISSGDINLDNTVNSEDLNIVRDLRTLGLPCSSKSVRAIQAKVAAADALFAEPEEDQNQKTEPVINSRLLALLAQSNRQESDPGLASERTSLVFETEPLQFDFGIALA